MSMKDKHYPASIVFATPSTEHILIIVEDDANHEGVDTGMMSARDVDDAQASDIDLAAFPSTSQEVVIGAEHAVGAWQ